MSKYQYKHAKQLPPEAAKEDVSHVRTACNQRATVSFGRSAMASLADWCIPEVQLRRSIIDHIETGNKMYKKYKDDGTGSLLPNHIQANVLISNNFNAYVEVILM